MDRDWHAILPNSKVRVVYGEHVGMIGVATEWSSQLKRWRVRIEYDESDRMAETVFVESRLFGKSES